MGTKLHKEQIRLFNSIDEILWNDWDPLSVNEFEEARDEYYNYTPMVFSLKIAGADIASIASKLHEIEQKWMGIDNGQVRCAQVAEKIFNLKID